MITNWKTYRPRLSPAMVIALLALVVALSAPAQAAMERLAAGTVGTAQLKNGAVTTPKIRDGAVTTPKIRTGAVTNPKIGNGAVTNGKIGSGAVTSSKIRDGSVGLGDLSSAATPRPPVFHGVELRDAAIPSGEWTTVLTLNLPAGAWMVFGKGTMHANRGFVMCELHSAGRTWDRTDGGVHGPDGSYDFSILPMTLGQRVVLSAAGSVEIRCASSADSSVTQLKLNAIQVR